MTYADPALIQARNYLMSLGIPGNSIGIVGDQSHQSSGGYHVGNDVLAAIGKLNTDYSKRQSARDRPGSNAAMALDVGGLTDANLWALSQFLVAQFLAGAPDTLDIREIIYWHAPSNTIKRVDRLGLYFSGDSSHRTHTHLSYFRDSEGRDKTSLFRRCYEPAPAPTPSKDDDDMKPVVFHKKVGEKVTYGLQTDSKFVQADEYAVAQRWAEAYGDSRAISESAFDALAAEYA